MKMVPMHWVGLVIVILVLGYGVCTAVDRAALPVEKAQARVTAKRYLPPGKTYITQMINNRPLVIPQARGESFAVELDMAGTAAAAVVSKDLYERLQPGDEVTVTFSRTRIRRRIEVQEVLPVPK